MTPKEWLLEDFRASGIPDDLTLANVRWIDGEEALQEMLETKLGSLGGHSQQYVTKQVAWWLQKYQHLAQGGWIAYGEDNVPYFKPKFPRQEFSNGKLKTTKYETSPGMEAQPLLPTPTVRVLRIICDRHGLMVEPALTAIAGCTNLADGDKLLKEAFWNWWLSTKCPVTITEGLKKALALMSQGYPAIAVRGITQWHQKGSRQLWPALARFTGNGRHYCIAFDQDAKAKTRCNVAHQIRQLGNALVDAGCSVSVAIWEPEQGKGIDDLLVKSGAEVFHQAIADAPNLQQWSKLQAKEIARWAIARLQHYSGPVERSTSGEYLLELPPLQAGAIHLINATVGSGKTLCIGKNWIQAAIALGWRVLALSPLNSLGQQSAQDWELPHIHDFATDATSQQALWAMVSAAGGLAMCPDSLHRLPAWFFEKPVLLVLDEVNQVISHITEGNTLGDRWCDINQRFAEVARHAIATGAIVGAEAGIPDHAVNYLKSISGGSTVRYFYHQRTAAPQPCTLYAGPVSGFRARLLQTGQSQRLLFVTTSQREARRLDRILTDAGRKVIRIDSETNECSQFAEFFRNPDPWLEQHQPDVLILSPSAKSGVSIQGNPDAIPYFEAVWAYFPSLATDTHKQLLGRFRPNVPRHIYVPPFILAGHNESGSQRQIRLRLQKSLEGTALLLGLSELLTGRQDLSTIEVATLDYLATARSLSGNQKSLAAEALAAELTSAGHIISHMQVETDKATSELWKSTQDTLWREDAEELASLQPEATQDPRWAWEVMNTTDSSRRLRLLASKVLARAEFPGIPFDDPEECYEALYRDWGLMRRGVLHQAAAENLEAIAALDREKARPNLSAAQRAPHQLPRHYIVAKLLRSCKLLELLACGSWSNDSPAAIAVKEAALKQAAQLSYWLRINVTAEQTPVAIANKLLRKLGLIAKVIHKQGGRGQQQRVWSCPDAENPLRQRLLVARREALKAVGTTRIEPHDQIETTSTVNPPPPVPPLPHEAAVSWINSEETAAIAPDHKREAIPIPEGERQDAVLPGELGAIA
jgi:hypothetical protein